jgi:CheY-specific phosphatase CheX
MITPKKRAELARESVESGFSFQELVEDEQLLDATQVNSLLESWDKARLDVGEALARLGHLEAEQLRQLSREFTADQRPYYEASIALPDALSSHRPARAVVGLFCQLLPTIAGVHVDRDRIRESEAPTGDLHKAAILARGASPLRVEMRADHELAVAVARGMTASPDFEPTASECEEVVAELLNVVVGNAVAVLEEDGLHLSIIPPDMNAPERVGSIVQLVTDHGTGWLLMDPAPAVQPRQQELELGADV